MPTPSTFTFPFAGTTSSTRPRLPLSRPAITTTWSFFLIFERFVPAIISNHLRRQRHYLHEVLISQLTRYRSKYARTNRRPIFLNQHRGVLIKPYVGAIGTSYFLTRSHDYRVLNRSLLNRAVGRSLFYGYFYAVAETCNLPCRAANGHDHFYPPSS